MESPGPAQVCWGDWSTQSPSTRTGVAVTARGKQVYTHIHTYSYIHTHSGTHMCTHAHIRTYTCTHYSRTNNGHPKILIPGTYKCHLMWEKGLCRLDEVKDLDLGGRSQVIQVDPKRHHRCPCKKGAEAGFTRTRRRPREVRGTGWRDAATAKGHRYPPEAGRGRKGPSSPRAF